MSSILLVALSLAVPPSGEITDSATSAVPQSHLNTSRSPIPTIRPLGRSVLAQQGAFWNPVAGRAQLAAPDLVDLIPKMVRPDAWEPLGGAGRIALFQRGGAGFGAGQGNQRTGQALADLIQETVDPDTWEIHGGRGRIAVFGQ